MKEQITFQYTFRKYLVFHKENVQMITFQKFRLELALALNLVSSDNSSSMFLLF